MTSFSPPHRRRKARPGGRIATEPAPRLAGLVRNRDLLRELTGRAEALSPLKVLARGYSVTSVGDAGPALRSAGDVQAGDEIRTRLESGALRSEVTEVLDADE